MLSRLLHPRRHLAAPADDQGYVMITVLGAMTVMSLLVTLTLNYSLQATHAGRNEQDRSAALAAAEAGVEDYLARLNADPGYFNKNVTTGGAVIATGARYDFKVTNSVTSIQSSGKINLESTGTVNGEKRKISVQLGKPSFLDYLYFTKYETTDPVANGSSTTTQCEKYRYPGTSSRDQNICPDIRFAASDVLDGDVYSQDSILIRGDAKFLGKFETGWNDPAKKFWIDDATNSKPTFSKGRGYRWLDFPSTNTSLKDQAAKPGGCLFKGPTRILFKSDGYMDVRSPYSGTTSGCGVYSASSPNAVQTVPVPDNNVIYVDDFTGTPTGCANASDVTKLTGFPIATDNSLTQGNSGLVYGCKKGDVFVEGWLKGRVTLGSANNIIVTGDLRYVGANNSATSTGIPTAAGQKPNAADSSGTDVLGLAATNFIEVYHPINCTWNNGSCTNDKDVTGSGYPKTNIQIDAMNVASAHSFIVPFWNAGNSLKQLTVLGGIVQKFRGPVAIGDNAGGIVSGYSKNYNYDPRLRYNPPPYLADLASSSWQRNTWAEVKP